MFLKLENFLQIESAHQIRSQTDEKDTQVSWHILARVLNFKNRKSLNAFQKERTSHLEKKRDKLGPSYS